VNGAGTRTVAAPPAAVDAAHDTTVAEEVSSSLGSSPAGPGAARRHPDDAADAVGRKAVAPAAVAMCERGGLQPGAQKAGDQRIEHNDAGLFQATVSIPRAHGREEKGAAEKDRKGRNARAAREAAPAGACGGGGGREAMVECALDVLLAVLEEEPGNREHVLRIDGGAPLVRGIRMRQ